MQSFVFLLIVCLPILSPALLPDYLLTCWQQPVYAASVGSRTRVAVSRG